EEGTQARFLELAKIPFTLCDQDIINIALAGKIGVMPKNFHPSLPNADIHTLVYHYIGREKPWTSYEPKFADIWWRYAGKTPFYAELLRKAWTSGFVRLEESTNASAIHSRLVALERIVGEIKDSIHSGPSQDASWPRWMVRFICCFVPGRKNRRDIREKYARR
ncbi:MAG: hypothetical protein LBL52_03025, partial [Rickettsiales bacterium]|nr:hypothetical protein [Rickettsiales bacterium]